MRLTPDQRRLIGRAVDRTHNKSLVSRVIGVTRKTIYKWARRRKQLHDRKRKRCPPKITLEVELFILTIRNTFHWGTERIQKALSGLPKFMLDTLSRIGVSIVQGVSLSRAAINNILVKHKLNGYKHNFHSWKFFRAKKPDEPWQLDIKGSFKVQGRKYFYVICIGDYSRYLVLAEQINHAPDVKEIAALLESSIRKHHPYKILTDNNPFREEWDNWCKENHIKSLYAHPYYPQDKGKVERSIRNIAEEFIYLTKKFPEWLNGNLKDYQKWFNTKRFNQGIQAIPC